MPTRYPHSLQKVSVRTHKSSHNHYIQYNIQHGSPLLDLPPESLTHISSYLPLPSLLALARTCKCLCEHVDDDNTWLRAFLAQFLGISPEHELDSQRILLLKRTEQTWRKEFIHRYTTTRRWTCSSHATVTYAPQDTSIDSIHLMPDGALLTSSIQYGIVARSIPLNGKVLKGYIDASGTGLGIGNPNAEFTPNVSVCTITSDSGTARVFWGKRSGEVALTVVMDSRAASRMVRCAVHDQHEGAVQHVISDSGSNTFISAGADGRIKLWDTKALRLLWSTDKQQVSLVTDPFVSITGSLTDRFVAGALGSGDILLYCLLEHEVPSEEPRACSSHQLRIPSPIPRERPGLTARGNDPAPEQQIARLWLHRSGDSSALLLIQYAQHPLFYRVHADVQSHDVTVTAFGDGSFGSVTAITPVFPAHARDGGMVITGDQLGFVSIYDSDAVSRVSVAPIHRFEAHGDAVTAIAYTPTTFATGTATGNTTIWGSLTLEAMRFFSTPAPRPAPGHDWDAVSQIVLDEDQVIIVVGNRVTTWKAGPVNSCKQLHTKPKHANTKLSVTTKGHQQYEMHKDITESYFELEYEKAHTRRVYGCEREQRSTLNTLGLSEVEAVEYVLMLSREEEEARQQGTIVDDGVFEGEFDDLPATPASSMSLYSSGSYHANGRQYPRVSLPISNEKVQVLPRFQPEPMEVGMSISPIRPFAIGSSLSAQPSPVTRSTSSSSPDHFPSLGSSLSSTSSSKRGASDPPRSAWSTPLKSSPSSPGPSSPHSRAIAPVMARARSANPSLLSADIVRHRESQVKVRDVEEIDDDLRLAIELSLAEARSKGSGV